MLALVFDGIPHVTEVPTPTPGRGEALVRVLSAGVCATDLEILRGYSDFKGVLGHEFVGVVQRCDNPHLLGKRVVGEINCVCHKCQYCLLEMPHHCLGRSVLGIHNRNGAFAEYLTLPEENLHLVPSSIPDDVAVFAEPTAAAFRIPEQVKISTDDRIIVLGDGRLGQLVSQVLWMYSKRLICVGRHPWKLELLNRLHIATAHMDDPIERGADLVVDATGSTDGLERALELVRPEGVVVLKTTTIDPTPMAMSLPVVNEVRIIGSRCGPFRPALEALVLGNVEVRPLVTCTYELRDGVEALKHAQSHDAIKILLHI